MEPEPPQPGPADPHDALCARYCRTTLWFRVAELAAQGLLLAALTVTGASERLVALTAGIEPSALGVFAFVALVATLTRAVALPWAWLNEHVIEARYGLSVQSGGAWFSEWLLRSALFVAGAVLVVGPLALALRWWWIALVPWLCLVMVGRALYYQWLYPVVMRRFYPVRLLRYESFHLPEIGRRILPVYQVEVSHKTRRVDAHLHLAGTRSAIYVTDTLIERFSDGEEKIVFAHEFGHLYDRIFLEERTPFGRTQAVRKALWGILQLAVVALAFALADSILRTLGMGGDQNLAGLPLVVALALIFAHLLVPVMHQEARHDEREADEYALKITGDVASYRSVMEKLRRLNLEQDCAHPIAHFLFGTHPHYHERLSLADAPPRRRPRRSGRGSGPAEPHQSRKLTR